MEKLRNFALKDVSQKTFALLSMPVFVFGGPAIAYIGYGLGVLTALTVGFPAPAVYGGAAGVEGAALFAGMVGSAVTSLILIAVWLRGSAIRNRILLTYVGVWLAVTIMHHYVVLSTQSMVPQYVVAPIIIIGVILSTVLYAKSRRA